MIRNRPASIRITVLAVAQLIGMRAFVRLLRVETALDTIPNEERKYPFVRKG